MKKRINEAQFTSKSSPTRICGLLQCLNYRYRTDLRKKKKAWLAYYTFTFLLIQLLWAELRLLLMANLL